MLGPGVTDHHGTHFTVDRLITGPAPVQQPRPPIWVAVRQGNTAPLRRAARYEGVFPVDLDGPEQLAQLVAAVQSHRVSDAGVFDVAAMADPTDDVAAWAEAGATWLLTRFSPFDLTIAEVAERIDAGPPT